MIDLPLSALEVVMVEAGRSAAETLHACAGFARELDRLGYRRLWYAEHHHSPAIGAFPPPIMTAHVAAATSAIKVGSGGCWHRTTRPSPSPSSSPRSPGSTGPG
ncbi:LLM class flavin-dependent oxidoreductase [Streptomyces sp. M19]